MGSRPDCTVCGQPIRMGSCECGEPTFGTPRPSELRRARDDYEKLLKRNMELIREVQEVRSEHHRRLVEATELRSLLRDFFLYVDRRIGNHGPIDLWSRVKKEIGALDPSTRKVFDKGMAEFLVNKHEEPKPTEGFENFHRADFVGMRDDDA